MAVLLVAAMKVRDMDKLIEYRKSAGPMLRQHGGELVAKSDSKMEDVQGSVDADSVLVFRFPSREAFRAWYDSPEYQALIPLREEGCEGNMALYEE